PIIGLGGSSPGLAAPIPEGGSLSLQPDGERRMTGSPGPGSQLGDLEELVQSLDAIVWEADARTWEFSFVSRRAEDILGKRAEGQLREAETRFRTLVEQVPVSVFVSAPEDGSTPIYISPFNETMLGYSAEEYLSDPRFWVTLVHPDDRERVVAEAARTDES